MKLELLVLISSKKIFPFLSFCLFPLTKNKHARKGMRRIRVHSSEGRLRRIIFLSNSSLRLPHAVWLHIAPPLFPIPVCESSTMSGRWAGPTREYIFLRVQKLSHCSVVCRVSCIPVSPLGTLPPNSLKVRQGHKSTTEFRACLPTAGFVPLLLGMCNRESLIMTGTHGL